MADTRTRLSPVNGHWATVTQHLGKSSQGNSKARSKRCKNGLNTEHFRKKYEPKKYVTRDNGLSFRIWQCGKEVSEHLTKSLEKNKNKSCDISS